MILMEEITSIKADIKEIKEALIGSPMNPNSVLTRIKDVEEKVAAIESNEIKNGIYFKILIFVSGIVATRGIYLIWDTFNSK